jgi:APA family basic amino acid/polyamine antiporter
MRFLQKKSFESVIKEVQKSHALEKTLTGFDLILLGLGFIVGTGVFVLTGLVSASYAGPAVTLSYAIAGLVCVFVALAYTELAVMVPSSGSIYSYAYIAFGEIVAWLMGGCILLNLGIGASVVAGGWSAYMVGLLESGGVHIPEAFTAVPSNGGIANLPAIFITCFVGIVLHLGTKDSKLLNAVLVFIKMGAILVFVIVAAPHFDIKNWETFVPFGFDNVIYGSSMLFFAFTGFGGLSAAAEECKNPKKDLIIGIIGSLALSTVVYVIIAGLLTGIVSYTTLGTPDSLAHALSANGSAIGTGIVTVGAVAGFTTVMLMQLFTTTRIFFVMSRDGLLPKSFAKVHKKFHSPYITIWLLVLGVSIVSGFFDIKLLAQVSSMGALLEYIMVLIIVMLFRFTLDKVERTFKCPAIWFIAPIGLVSCVYLLYVQIVDTNGNLRDSGSMLFYWFLGIAMFYVLRSFSLPKIAK